MPGADLSTNAALLDELRALTTLIRPDSVNGLTALVRTVQGSPSAWEALLQSHELLDWLVLPLDENAFPGLARLQRHIQTLTHQKDHDALSGLRNRAAFDAALALEVERAGRYTTPLSLCVMDLDNFKAVNDTYGHPCGDEVIRTMASILLAQTRKIDVAARIGGEEFALLLPATGLARATQLLERILDKIRAARVACGQPHLSFTCSMGLAGYRGKKTPDPDRLLAEADQALYRAKKAGKNRLETAPLLDLEFQQTTCQVLCDEKRFLFSTFSAPGDPGMQSE